MADIYAAQDSELERPVAVKLLSERFADDPGIRARFEREALAAAKLSGHPHIATIYDVGDADGRPFIVMELLRGGTVADRLRTGPVPPERALTWLAQAASALDAAHAEGIVHRDVKPANLLLDDNDDLHVTDFGIARILDEAAGGATATGTVLGTAGYLSPEQARGAEATPASDVYGLGIVAYELLTGGRPFERAGITAEASAHVNEPVPPASERAELPPPVDAVFARALAKDPAYRYGSAQDFVDDLHEALLGETTTATVAAVPPPAAATVAARRRAVARRRLVPAAAGGLLLAGGIAAAFLLASGGESKRAPAPVRTTHRSSNRASTPAVVPPPSPSPAPAPPAAPRKGKGKGKKKGHFKHGKGHGKAEGEQGEGDQQGQTLTNVTTSLSTTAPVTTETISTAPTTVDTTTTVPTGTTP
jgi:serine/threonine-protein kinase